MEAPKSILALPARRKVPDSAFAHAFASVDGDGMAILKRSIARLFSVHPPESGASPWSRRQTWTDSLGDIAQFSAPLDFAAILLPRTVVSPVKLLAALIPARTAGISQVVVLRPEAASWEPDVLVALELAGQEDVYGFDDGLKARILANLRKTNARGIVLDMSGEWDEISPLPNILRIRLDLAASIGVFLDGPDGFDLRVIARLHPDSPITVWNSSRKVRGMRHRSGDFESFLGQSYAAAFVPRHLADSALSRVPLTLSPGSEFFWWWPRPVQADFRVHGLCLTAGAQDG